MSTVVKDLGAVSAYAYAVEKGYTGTEAEFAELMADYAEVGQRAEDAADSALESKTAAQTAATTATNKASEATTAATTATNKAAEAQADADAAALDASQAMSAASTATTKATEATTAAATATSAKTDAVAANTAAQSAKTAAQTAQTGAETAAASVQSSAAQIATNTSDINELKEDLTLVENGTKTPVTFTNGTNVFVGNHNLYQETNAKRSGVMPLPCYGGTVYVLPKNGYTIHLLHRTAGSWTEESAQTGFFSFTFTTQELFAFQVISSSNIPSDAVPFDMWYVYPQDNRNDALVEEPLTFEVGVNRYLTGTTLVTTNIASRASVAPFHPKSKKIRITVTEDYWYSAKQCIDGKWYLLSESDTVMTTEDYTLDDNASDLCISFGRTPVGSNRTLTAPINPVRLTYPDLMGTIEGLSNEQKIISNLTEDVNKESLWEIGSFGSNGEPYTRNNEIRTKDFLPLEGMVETIRSSDTQSYFCAYNASKTFVGRVKNPSAIFTHEDIKHIYPTAEYYKFTLWTGDSDVSDVTNYSKAKILYIRTSAEFDAPVISEEKQAYYNDLISQARYSYANTDSGVDSSPRVLTLLHFSDVHGNEAGMKYALAINNLFDDKIDDMLHTGDVVTANFSDGITNWINSGCASKVLNVIGNHDTEVNLVLQAAGKTNVYNTIFAPYIDGWGVTQPEGVDDSTSDDYCALYYYKDYATPKIRLIVLDTNFWDEAEETWLTNVLADAKTNSYAVLLACHNVKQLTEMNDSNFATYKGDGINETTNAYANQPADWLDCVDDFIEGGGEFICMLAGHNHAGHMGYLTNYPDIFCYVCDKGSYQRVTGTARVSGEINQNTVSIVTVNAKEKLFKIVKIGAEVDGHMKGKHVFCYDYANKQIIAQW